MFFLHIQALPQPFPRMSDPPEPHHNPWGPQDSTLTPHRGSGPPALALAVRIHRAGFYLLSPRSTSKSTGLPAPELEPIFFCWRALSQGREGPAASPSCLALCPEGQSGLTSPSPLAGPSSQRQTQEPLSSPGWKGGGQVLGFARVSSREPSHLSRHVPPWLPCLDSPRDRLLTTSQGSPLSGCSRGSGRDPGSEEH